MRTIFTLSRIGITPQLEKDKNCKISLIKNLVNQFIQVVEPTMIRF